MGAAEEGDCFRFTTLTAGTLQITQDAPTGDCVDDKVFVSVFGNEATAEFESFATLLGQSDPFLCTAGNVLLAAGTWRVCAQNFADILDPVAGITLSLTLAAAPVAGLCDASARLTNAAEAALVAPCTTITGDLLVTGNVSNVDALASLTAVDGRLEIENAANLSNVSGLAALAEVGQLRVQDTALTTLALPGLTSAAAVDVSFNAALTSMALDALVTIDDPNDIQFRSLNVFFNDALTTLSLASLTSVDADVQVNSNAALPQCALDALFAGVTLGGALEMTDNDAAAVCD